MKRLSWFSATYCHDELVAGARRAAQEVVELPSHHGQVAFRRPNTVKI